jgi:hypothetical protein
MPVAQPLALPVAEPAPAPPPAPRRAGEPAAANLTAVKVRALLRGDNLATAVLLREILDPPLCRRPRR